MYDNMAHNLRIEVDDEAERDAVANDEHGCHPVSDLIRTSEIVKCAARQVALCN